MSRIVNSMRHILLAMVCVAVISFAAPMAAHAKGSGDDVPEPGWMLMMAAGAAPAGYQLLKGKLAKKA